MLTHESGIDFLIEFGKKENKHISQNIKLFHYSSKIATEREYWKDAFRSQYHKTRQVLWTKAVEFHHCLVS